MPFLGIPVPVVRATVRTVLADPAYAITQRRDWEATVLALWDGATHREERYAALGLLRHARHRAWRDRELAPLLRHLVLTGAWWDLVDETSQVIGEVLAADHRFASVVRGWAVDDDLWLRRAAIISQLGAKDRTDADLLHACIEPNLGDRAFFVRKTIGWALRRYAETDPDWVRAVVAEWGEKLSPLSRREALRHLAGPDASSR